MLSNVKVTEHEQTVNFNVHGYQERIDKQGNKILVRSNFAYADFNKIRESALSRSIRYFEDCSSKKFNKQVKKQLNWYLFARINMPDNFIPQNAGVLLMLSVVKWADSNNIAIIDYLSPYGRLNMLELVRFNKLFGFKPMKDNIMVRLPK